jgi:hypothetical protein
MINNTRPVRLLSPGFSNPRARGLCQSRLTMALSQAAALSNSYFNTPPSLYQPHPPRPHSIVRPSVLQNALPVVTLHPSRLAHLRQQVK